MNNTYKKNKPHGGRFKNNHKRHHHSHNKNKDYKQNTVDAKQVVTETAEVKEEKKKDVEQPKERKEITNLYTRNLEPLEEGYRLPAMTLFNAEEEEFNLNDDRSVKVYVTIPTFENKVFPNEVYKLDIILKEFPSLNAYIISNEPVYTQKRLSKPYKFDKFRILSDFKNREFARNTGTYIYELSLLVKSIFIVDKNDRILYVRYFDDLYSNFNFNEINNTIKEIYE